MESYWLFSAKDVFRTVEHLVRNENAEVLDVYKSFSVTSITVKMPDNSNRLYFARTGLEEFARKT